MLFPKHIVRPPYTVIARFSTDPPLRLVVLHSADLDLPTPPARLFGRTGPLAVEIGFGGGRFLRHLCTEHPEWNILGVEISLASISRTYRRLQRAGCTNARLWRGHAGFLVREVIPERSLHRAFVNFPDPWPKKRHRERRLLQTPFFELLATRLRAGGALSFTSDHEEYFHAALEEAATTDLYRIERGAPPEAALQTKYARKWQQQGKTIHHATFYKESEPATAFPPRLRKTEMHHAILKGTLPEIDTFETRAFDIEHGKVVLLDAYRELSGAGYLIQALVQEGELRQDLLIEARPGSDDLYVGVTRFGSPLITSGTSAAVRFVSEWLEEQGCEIVDAQY